MLLCDLKSDKGNARIFTRKAHLTESTTSVPRIHTEESFVADQFRFLSLTLASWVNELVKRTRKCSTRARSFGTCSPLKKINSLTYSNFSWSKNCFLLNLNLLLKWQKYGLSTSVIFLLRKRLFRGPDWSKKKQQTNKTLS